MRKSISNISLESISSIPLKQSKDAITVVPVKKTFLLYIQSVIHKNFCTLVTYRGFKAYEMIYTFD